MSKDDISVDAFEAWLKSEKHKAIDAKNGGLLIVRTGTWVDAFETFRKEYKPSRREKDDKDGTGTVHKREAGDSGDRSPD